MEITIKFNLSSNSARAHIENALRARVLQLKINARSIHRTVGDAASDTINDVLHMADELEALANTISELNVERKD